MEILTKKSREIDVIDDKIKQLANDMLETMYSKDGIERVKAKLEVFHILSMKII